MKKKIQNKTSNKEIGSKGEDIAAQFLQKLGYRIFARNEYTHWGEIDLIAFDRDTAVFVEVKTRRTFGFGSGVETVNLKKQLTLQRCARRLIQTGKVQAAQYRFDVVIVGVEEDESRPPDILCVKAHYTNITG